MRRLWLVALGLIVLIVAAGKIRHDQLKREAQRRVEAPLKADARKKREVAYQEALRHHSDRFKPGLTRKALETVFRAEGVEFSRMGWLEEKVKDRTAIADLVKIGEEEVPRYCSEHYVYIAFQFAATEPHEPWAILDTDTLTTIGIHRRLWGCL